MRFDLEPLVQRVGPSRVAVLLINLGTPDEPTPRAVRRYLAQFLSDPRVVELPALIWQPLLRALILPLRSRASAKKYAAVWMPEGSPLRVYTQRQAQALQQWLSAEGYAVHVEYAMRYGLPSMAAALHRLKQAGVEHLLLMPMYPQYSSSTTATAFDHVFAAFKSMRNQLEIRTVRHYADHPAYIHALTEHVRDYWATHGRPDFAAGDKLMLSFHGVPKRVLNTGDLYPEHCQRSAALLTAQLGLTPHECPVTFQSRFGRAQWLQPYTVSTLKELGAARVRRVDVFCPGFVADCLETIEEMGIEGRHAFLSAGGGAFHLIPCLNASPAWVAALGEIVTQHLQGWSVTV